MSKTIIKAYSDAAGVSIGQPNQTAIVYSDTDQTALTSNIFVKVALNNITYNPAGNFDATTNYRFQPTVAGRYQINSAVYIRSTTADSLRAANISIYLNGVKTCDGWSSHPSTGAHSGTMHPQVAHVIELNGTTDYIEIFARGFTTSGTWYISSGQTTTYFSAFKIPD